jgi:hypothetical protein
MNEYMKVWLFRVLAAVVGVGLTAIAGIHADMAHFGAWFAIVAAAQAIVLGVLGTLVRKWTS